MNYILNIDKIKILSKSLGFANIGELCEKAKIHRNSITPYIKHNRSPFTQVVLEISNTLNVPAIELIKASENKEISYIKNELAKFLDKEHAVFLFGSRARKLERKFSDIDLGITGGHKKISFSNFVKIKSTLEEAFDNFSLSINFVNLDMAPLDFLLEIEKDLTFISGNEKTSHYFMGYIDGRKTN